MLCHTITFSPVALCKQVVKFNAHIFLWSSMCVYEIK